MTKKQFTKLLTFEESFKLAKAGYYRALPRESVQEMAVVYQELGYVPGQLNCNRCILTMLKNLATEYDNYKNKTTKKDEA